MHISFHGGIDAHAFSTGEIAKLTGCSQQTIIRSFDDGLLEGYRVPGSRFRRSTRDQLMKFMKTYGIDTDIPPEQSLLLIARVTEEYEDQFKSLLEKVVRESEERTDLHLADTSFEAGILAAERTPDAVILDAHMPGYDRIRHAVETRAPLTVVNRAREDLLPLLATVERLCMPHHARRRA